MRIDGKRRKKNFGVCGMNENVRLGNITIEDALKLKRYLRKLCDYLSRHYEELKGMSDMTDESFMTDIDIMCEEHEKAMAEKDVQLAEQSSQLAEQSSQLAEQSSQLAEQKNHLIAATKALIAQGMSEEEARSITNISLE